MRLPVRHSTRIRRSLATCIAPLAWPDGVASSSMPSVRRRENIRSLCQPQRAAR